MAGGGEMSPTKKYLSLISLFFSLNFCVLFKNKCFSPFVWEKDILYSCNRGEEWSRRKIRSKSEDMHFVVYDIIMR